MLNIRLYTSLMALVLGVAANAKTQDSQSKSYPFVCNVKALTSAERARLPKYFGQIVAASPKVRELPNGYELTFAQHAAIFPAVSAWVSGESKCCGFFDFNLSITHGNGALVLKITGPAGVKEFIAGDLPKFHQLVSGR